MARMRKIKKVEREENAVDIKIEDFCSYMDLEIIHKGDNESMNMKTFNINRPGLQLAGFFEHFGEDRIQVVGEQEIAFLKTLTPTERESACNKLFTHHFPCMVLSTGLETPKEILKAAEHHNRVILRSKLRTTTIVNELSIFLNDLLAPNVTIHGVLLDIYGVGVLIIGDSSVGKSETAIELIQRNHRLVADDAVTIKRVSDSLVGTSPSIIRYFMEVRGIGIIDIRSMYGAGAVRLTKMIDLVIKLEEWDTNKEYDRLGSVKEYHNILDVEIPMQTIPVKPGRNLAVILEVAARNHRLKSMGYDTLAELDKRLASKKPNDDPFKI